MAQPRRAGQRTRGDKDGKDNRSGTKTGQGIGHRPRHRGIEQWGVGHGPDTGPVAGMGRLGSRSRRVRPLIEFTSRRALRRILWSPGQLGLSRAYVAGEIKAHGDIFAAFAALSSAGKFAEPGPFSPPTPREVWTLVKTGVRLGALGPTPLPRPKRRGWKSTAGGTPRNGTPPRSHTITTSATTFTGWSSVRRWSTRARSGSDEGRAWKRRRKPNSTSSAASWV